MNVEEFKSFIYANLDEQGLQPVNIKLTNEMIQNLHYIDDKDARNMYLLSLISEQRKPVGKYSYRMSLEDIFQVLIEPTDKEIEDALQYLIELQFIQLTDEVESGYTGITDDTEYLYFTLVDDYDLSAEGIEFDGYWVKDLDDESCSEFVDLDYFDYDFFECEWVYDEDVERLREHKSRYYKGIKEQKAIRVRLTDELKVMLNAQDVEGHPTILAKA